MGLLGTEDFDPATQGLLAAAFKGMQASGPSRMPVSLGQVIGAGGEAGMGAYSNAKQHNLQRALMQLNLDEGEMKKQLMAMQVKQQDQALKDQEYWRGLFGGNTPTSGVTPSQALGMGASVGQVGPTPQAAAMIGQPSAPEASPVDKLLAGTGIDRQTAAMLMRGDPTGKTLATKIAESKIDLNKPRISANGQTVVPEIGPDGKVRITMPQGALDAYTAYQGVITPQQRFEQLKVDQEFFDKTGKHLPGFGGEAPSMPQSGAIPPSAPPIAPQPMPRPSFPPNPMPGAANRPPLLTPPEAARGALQWDNAARGNVSGDVGAENPYAQIAAYRKAGKNKEADAIEAAFNGDNPLMPAAQTALSPAQTREAVAAESRKLKEGRIGNLVEYEKGLNASVIEGGKLNMRLQESLDALDKVKAGGGAEARQAIAKLAQAIPGIDSDLLDKIQGGGKGAFAAGQVFNKLAAQQAMETLKESMGGAGRIAQAEFKVFQTNNPNLTTDPDAIRKIYDFATRVYNSNLKEQEQFNKYLESGKDPASWPAYWAKQSALLGYTNPNLNTASKNNNWANGRSAGGKIGGLENIMSQADAIIGK